MEIWGGVECTLNRVGDSFYSQCERNGHAVRSQDIEKFAQLGIKKIRYPCLWESVCREEDHFNWQWLDERLTSLREKGLEPVVGLLHHGSGPAFTNLLDPAFPEKFARYAARFAERYPWIQHYTPIDEILTTARFSCLYGHWYPHHSSDPSFVRALFHQVKATILAMTEIRKFNSEALLIQAEDLGRAQSTEVLNYQRDFENDRRWLAFDMLMGRLSECHPLYRYLSENGMTSEEVQWLQENALPPDRLGINHYLLSNRYLDHRLEMYPEYCHGANYFHRYADISSADTDAAEYLTPQEIYSEAWQRYHIPLVITEVHIRGHREDQMRWLHQIWNECVELNKNGVQVQAVTAWSLLGSYDWDRLCTQQGSFYEPGVFDLRTPDGSPKATALGHMIQRLGSGMDSNHPILEQPGWWRLRQKLLYKTKPQAAFPISKSRPIVITGGRGTLGKAFGRLCEQRHLHYALLSREELDIANGEAVQKVLDQLQPWAVINAAGYEKIDLAESNSATCFRENVLGAKNLAEYCATRNIRFATYSSDLVFDGQNHEAYLESHFAAPLNVYGHSKRESEEQVLRANPNALVIRTSAFFGPWDRMNFATRMLEMLHLRQEVSVASDAKVSVTYIPDLVHASLDLILDEERGLVHLTNQGGRAWTDIAKNLVRTASRHQGSLDDSLIIEKPMAEFHLPAKRPLNSVLSSERLRILPEIEDAMDRYFWELNIS